MSKKTDITPPDTPAAQAPAGRAAYHAGPPAIEFGGRRWQRGQAQTLTADEFAALQSRADAALFGFIFDKE